ncbi:class II histocompatibility antigen, B-L beta chain-like isoform X2 [Rhinoraja longicauda]
MKGDGPGRRWPRGDGGTATAAATALSLLFLLFMLDATALGMHVVQLSLSCAGKDVSLSFLRLAYDGEELIRFEYSSNTFVAANPLAEPYVEGLNDDKRTVQNVARYIRRVPLISQIIEDSIRAETAKPAVTITARHPNGHEGPLVLTCRVDGFYPRDINTTWLRNGKDIDQEVLRSNILPNSDGTFQIRLQLSLDPSGGDTYSCQITHRSVPDNLTAVWVPKIQKVPVYGFVVGIMAGLVGILIAVSGGVMRWKGLHVMHQFCGCSQRGQRTVVTWVDSFDERDHPVLPAGQQVIRCHPASRPDPWWTTATPTSNSWSLCPNWSPASVTESSASFS